MVVIVQAEGQTRWLWKGPWGNMAAYQQGKVGLTLWNLMTWPSECPTIWPSASGRLQGSPTQSWKQVVSNWTLSWHFSPCVLKSSVVSQCEWWISSLIIIFLKSCSPSLWAPKLINKFQTQILKQDPFKKIKKNLKGGGNVDTGSSSQKLGCFFYIRMKINDAFL